MDFNFDFDFDRESPFQPGMPVTTDCFIGRKKTLEKILRQVNNVLKGRPQHFFLTGKRRMGKMSVINFVQNFACYKKNMVKVYVSNKGNHSIEILALRVIEALINEMPQDSRLSNIKKWFGDHIESIEIKGMKIKFEVDKKLSRSFKDYFQDYISEIFDEFSVEKSGIFIVIDDINGLSDSGEFADWYKNLADTLAIKNQYQFPVYFLLAGYPEKFDALVRHEESFGSIFHFAYIDCLSDCEVADFFKSTFSQVDIEVSKEALDIMVKFSSGVPLMMQQIGDSVFWECTDNYVSQDNALNGVIRAAYEIGSKQIKPILDQIKSINYNYILEFLAENRMQSFKRSEIKNNLDVNENILDNFLKRMIELGILESVGHKSSGMYKFDNMLYYAYFLIKSVEKS